METRQITASFSSSFSSHGLLHSFLNLKILKIHFHVFHPLVHSGLKNTSIFGQKLSIQKAHHTFQESRHPEISKNLCYVLPPAEAKFLFF